MFLSGYSGLHVRYELGCTSLQAIGSAYGVPDHAYSLNVCFWGIN